VPGKRKKDAAVHEIRKALERLHDVVEAYRRSLEAELTATLAEAEPYGHLVRSLERQIGSLRNLEEALDEQVWPQVIGIANTSAYVEHTRTRDFF
jgi:hypothetical protein